MIRITVTGAAVEGRLPFRIDTEGTRLASPINAMSAAPMFDACQMLRDTGVADANAQIGLFEEGAVEPRYSTTIQFGAERRIVETPTGPKLESTTHKTVLPEGQRTVVEEIEHDELNAEMPTRSEEPPPPPRKSRGRPAGKGRVEKAPDKPAKSPHKRKPAVSSGRRGRR